MTDTEIYLARPMGRPRIEIDWGQFEKLCELHCTLKEISGYFRCSEDTVERRCLDDFGVTFAVLYKEFSSVANISLRRAQWTAALAGDRTMLIWLGKQILGQKDIPESPKLGDDEDDTIKGLAGLKRRLNPATPPGETLNVNKATVTTTAKP